MDELNLEPLEPLESAKPGDKRIMPSRPRRWNSPRLMIPAGIVLVILVAIGIYLMVDPAPDPPKLIAQVFEYLIVHTPDTARVVMSISNKQDKQAVIVKIYPVYFGKDRSQFYSRSIEERTMEGADLPLVMNPGEVRVLKINFLIRKKDLDEYAGRIKDSAHVRVYADPPAPGQVEGYLGLGWQVVDADGKNFTNDQHIAYYVLKPAPPGFGETTLLDHSWFVSQEPFELCTQIPLAE